MTLEVAIRNLYLARWGNPSRQGRFDVVDVPVDVYKWDASPDTLGVALYATVGASEFAPPGHHPTHRVEFLIGLLPPKDEVAKPLAMLASYQRREATALDHGHSVTFAEPFWPGTELQTFLVMRPFPDVLETLELPGSIHVGFLQVIPLFPVEQSFKAAHGADELMLRLEEAGVPFWDPGRLPGPSLD